MEGQEGLIAVVGLGQIGGSIARRLASKGLRVLGVDRDVHILDQARSIGAIRQGYEDIELIRHPVEILVLASWPDSIIEYLSKPNLIPAASLITDCASVKGPCEAACHPNLQGAFVGGHPMAGNEGVGWPSSNPDLFEERTWVLCPSATSKTMATELAVRFVKHLGAKPLVMSAEDHDREVALLSHLPNLLANLLTLAAEGIKNPELAAGTWNGATRVAGSNPQLWGEILRQNQTHLHAMIDDLVIRLRDAREKQGFEALWQKAAEIKNNQGW